MLAYLVSVSVRLLLAYAIGSPSCYKQVPSPFGRHPPVLSLASFGWFWLGGTLGNQVLYFLEAGICNLIPGKDRILLKHCPERLSVVAQMWHEVSHVCYHSNEAG